MEKIENLGAVNRSLAIEREFFLCYLDNWSAMFSCNETEATVKSSFKMKLKISYGMTIFTAFPKSLGNR